MTPSLYISPRPRMLAERAQLQPLPCMSLTQGPSLCGSSSRPRQIKNRVQILHTPFSFILFPFSCTRKWNAQTKGPSVTPSQVSLSLGSPYVPPMEARSVLVQEVKNSHLGARIRRKTITPRWQLIQAFQQIIRYRGIFFITIIHHQHNHPSDISSKATQV